ncbi:HD-GYP domain-containing protein [Motilimonas sp. E26]|uniref:HD-GYP domain-containing protein n=1 Tax=Motilimonas TaxID=1914248 RepID=UPI001E3DD49C|nr:HD-GYP domain-containing protein [Motilimonas sp. E26]MCE0555474.1 HD-GYP domain-containing protein [Motilimonas sp. E26]
MLVEKKLSELEIGHYIVDIIEQAKNYKITHACYVETPRTVATLHNKGVVSVMIDTSKTRYPTAIDDDEPEVQNPDSAGEKSQAGFIKRMTRATEIFKESKQLQKKIFHDAQSGRELDLAPVMEATNKVIDEIFQNSDALASVINIRKKDQYLLEHSVSVSVLIAIFAKFLKLERNIIHQLAIGAFLHDVGKIMVPDAILNKPGKLTDNEFTIMKTHVNHSIHVIERTPNISKLSLEVAALHHEKINGTGYPYKVRGQNISKYGRMIAICDIFDALTANRVYKDGFAHIKAFNILRRMAQDEDLDAELVDSFIKCMGVYPVGTLVELNSNQLAIVESSNPKDPICPKVRPFFSMQQHDYKPSKAMDLSEEDDFIIKGVRPDDFELDMDQVMEFLMRQG